MVVDKGELRYGINVRAGNSFRTLRTFRKELELSRKAFESFRGSLAAAKGAGADVRRELDDIAESARGVREETKRQGDETKRTSNTERQAARERQAEVRRRLRSFGRLTRARRAQASEAKKQQAEERRLAAIQSRAAAAKARADAKAIRDSKSLNRELKETQSTANRVAFTFRRLFGILAAFTIAREALAAFNGLIGGGVRFGETIEQSRIGIGGLIAATGEARDAAGELVDPILALPAAFEAAEGSVRRLRQQSLRTVATFEQLLSTFQVAVAPGFTAGLELEQIETLATRVTQAAQALGVPLNQLSEEIRALLTGNITGRTTRIATALGITPDTIRQAREQNRLAEVLEERFRTFNATAENVARTLTGTFARLRGVFQELTAQASTGLRGELTEALDDIIGQFVTLNEVTGELELNPAALAAATEIFEAVAGVVGRVREEIQDLDFGELASRARAFGLVAREAFGALLTILPSILRAISDFATIAAVALRVLAGLGPIVGFVLRIQLSFLAIKAVISPLVSLFTAIPLAVLRWQAAQAATAAAAAATATSATAAAGATSLAATAATVAATKMNLVATATARAAAFANLLVTGIGLALVAANPLLESMLGMELTIGQSTELLARGFIVQVKNATLEVRKLGLELTEALGLGQDTGRSFFEGLSEAFGNATIAVVSGFDDLFGGENSERLEGLLAARINAGRDLAEERGKLRDIDKEIADLTAQQVSNDTDLAAILTRIDAANARRLEQEEDIAKATEAARKAQEEINKLTKGGGTTFGPPAEDVTEDEAEKLRKLGQQTSQLLAQSITKRQIAALNASEISNAERLEAVQLAKIAGIRRELSLKQSFVAAQIRELETQRDTARGEERKAFFTRQINLLKRQENALTGETNAFLDVQERTLRNIRRANAAALRSEIQKTSTLVANNQLLAIGTELTLIQSAAVGDVGAAQQRALAAANAQVSRQRVQAELQQGATLLAIENLETQEDQTEQVQLQIAALKEKLSLEQQSAAANAQELERVREIARIRAEGSASEGAALGIQQFQESLGTVATQLEELVGGVLTTLTQGLGQSLTSALTAAFEENPDDPTETFSDRLKDNLKEVAGQILQQIAAQILQTTINLLLQRFLIDNANETKKRIQQKVADNLRRTEIATFASSQRALDLVSAKAIAAVQIATAQTIATIQATSGGSGRAYGGFISSGRYASFAGGGHVHNGLPRSAPPPGVPKSDTVNTYLTPGEFVTRTDSVRAYGLQVMDAINRRLIDPSLMKGMIGMKRQSNVMRHASKGPGFQTGGLVSDTLAASASRVSQAVSSETGAIGGGAVAVPVDADKFEIMLAAGKEGFRRYLRDNAADFDGILRQGRTGG